MHADYYILLLRICFDFEIIMFYLLPDAEYHIYSYMMSLLICQRKSTLREVPFTCHGHGSARK